MGKPRSPLIFCSHLHFVFSPVLTIYAIPIVILLLGFSNLVCGIDEFHSLIELPRSTSAEYFRNSSSNSSIVLYVQDFGAKGNGTVDDTEAFGEAWKKACSSGIPAKIIVPGKKTFLIRPIDFGGPCKSNVTLRIDGTIVSPKDPEIWKGLDPNKWLYFHQIKNLTVEGRGTVDGNGHKWWAQSCKINQTNPCRHAPKAITFHKCRNLKVRYITVINSQQMHMAFTSSRQIAISHLGIFAPPDSPNTDGIHISACTNVEIKSNVISTGDDCISIVSNSSKIRVKDITCGPGHGISIGSLGKSNAWDQVHDVEVNGAFLSNTENGVRIKTWQGGSGYVKKITFENVIMENVSNPIIIDQYYCDSFDPCPNQTLAVNISSISFIGIKGTSATEEAITFACSDHSPCKGLHLDDIQLVSYTGDFTSSFCWKAHGSSSGYVYPPPCFSSKDDHVILQKTQSSSIQFI